MTTLYVHPDKPGFQLDEVSGSQRVNLASDPATWNQVNEIVAQVAAGQQNPAPPLNILDLAKRYKR
jgi:hypothetical protein